MPYRAMPCFSNYAILVLDLPCQIYINLFIFGHYSMQYKHETAVHRAIEFLAQTRTRDTSLTKFLMGTDPRNPISGYAYDPPQPRQNRPHDRTDFDVDRLSL